MRWLVNEYANRLEWMTWDRQTSGYKGYRANPYFSLVAVLLR
jgi:hypothetical protein